MTQALTRRDAVAHMTTFLAKPKRLADLAAALPEGFDSKRMARIALTMVAKSDTSLALACYENGASFWSAMLESAQLGLTLDGPLGQAYLIPRRISRKITDGDGNTKWVKQPEVQLQIGYKGWVALACRTGAVTHVSAGVVREGDFFQFEHGSTEYLRHIPNDKETKNGAPTHAYAIGHNGTATPPFVVLTRAEVLKARDFGGNSGPKSPWTLHPDAMWKKTAITRLCSGRCFPLSAEIRQAQHVEAQSRMTVPAAAFVDPDGDGDDEDLLPIDPDTGEVRDADFAPEPPLGDEPPPADEPPL